MAEQAVANNEIDIARSALIDADGFTLLKALISEDDAAETRARIMANIDQARDEGNGVFSLPNILATDPAFATMATNPRLLALAKHLLGDDVKLAAFSAKILNPGCSAGGLHIDYPYWAMPRGLPVDPPLMLQVIWMMEPFTTENGGTWVAPGSHRWTEPLSGKRFYEAAIQAEGCAGDAIVSHGLLWHRTAENHSTEPRVAFLINFTQLAIQPMTPMGPFDDETMSGFSPELQSLLGVDHQKHLRNRIRNLK